MSAVRPVDVPQAFELEAPGPEWAAGPGNLQRRGKRSFILRILQSVFLIILLSILLSITDDFPTLRTYYFVVSVAGFQLLWSLSIGVLDGYAIRAGYTLKNPAMLTLFSVVDGVIATLVFMAATGSAGIVLVLIRSNEGDKEIFSEYHYTRVAVSTVMTFIAWMVSAPSFVLNYWSLAKMQKSS